MNIKYSKTEWIRNPTLYPAELWARLGKPLISVIFRYRPRTASSSKTEQSGSIRHSAAHSRHNLRHIWIIPTMDQNAPDDKGCAL